MKKRNLFKIAALTAVFALGSMFANAQVTTGPDYTKQANTVLGQAGGSVKVIDNKGTVKYIQTANGLTTFTDAAPDGGIVTTFQLGGTLTSNTTLTLNTGVELSIQGLQAVSGSYELIVIEPDGNLKKMALTDLIDAGTFVKVITSSDAGFSNGEISTSSFAIPITGVTLESFKTVYVFRNGAKLIAGIDYDISTASGTSTVTLRLTATGNNYATEYPSANTTDTYENFSLYAKDRIEVQYIK